MFSKIRRFNPKSVMCFSTRVKHLSSAIQSSLDLPTKYSHIITQPEDRGNAQAMLWALPQFTVKKDFQKPHIGVGSVWYESNPCNAKLNHIAKEVSTSVNKQNMLPFQFCTPGVSDGITMGTDSMRMSLLSRDWIADGFEMQTVGGNYDGLIAIPGCDKNMPGVMMALFELNRPGLVVYGGSMPPSYVPSDVKRQKPLDIVSAFTAPSQYKAGFITENEKDEIIKNACHGSCGACAGMFTANTMSSAIEIMGMSLPNSATNPSMSKEKMEECNKVGSVMKNLLISDLKPLDIVTKESFINAIKLLYIMGGSTNGVIHLLAMARSANIDLNVNDFIKYQHLPVLADMRPHGRYAMNDLHNFGGMGPLVNYLIDLNIINGDCMTVTGKTLAENYQDNKEKPSFFHDLIRPIEEPFKETSHIRILSGNIAPEGCVSKIYNEQTHYRGDVLVYDTEQNMMNALSNNEITKNNFIVIRYQGETVGCPEMLIPTSALVGHFGDIPDLPPLATDGRFSGGSKGILIAHLPDAYKSNITSNLQNGDVIEIDLTTNSISAIRDGHLITDFPEMEKKEADIVSILKKYNKLVQGFPDGFTNKVL